MSDGDDVKLGGVTDDVDEAFHFGLVRQTHAEQFDGRVVDVVVCRNHAQVERSHVHPVHYVDALKQWLHYQQQLQVNYVQSKHLTTNDSKY